MRGARDDQRRETDDVRSERTDRAREAGPARGFLDAIDLVSVALIEPLMALLADNREVAVLRRYEHAVQPEREAAEKTGASGTAKLG